MVHATAERVWHLSVVDATAQCYRTNVTMYDTLGCRARSKPNPQTLPSPSGLICERDTEEVLLH
jgi:hypothetical protein